RPRVEVRKIQSMQLGSEFAFNDATSVKVELFGSRAEQDDTNRVNSIYRSGRIDTPVTWDNSNPKKPALNLAPGFFNAANCNLTAFEAEFAIAEARTSGAKVDFTTD